MIEKQKKQPEIRFNGFTDDWEQRKLGEVVKITMGQSPDSKNYTDNSKDYILVQGNADMKNGHVVPRVWTTQVTKEADVGDLILSVRAPVGDIGKSDYHVVLGRGVAAIKGNEFIFQYLVKMKITGYWTRYSTGSTFESINSNNIKEAEVLVPIEVEQDKIGNLFSNVDNLITLHQREYDNLKSLKKTLLTKMFPKKGESKPELRFEGFTDSWEQRKFSNLLDKNDGIRRGPFGSALKKAFFVPESEYVVYEQQNAIYDRYDTRYNITEKKFKELHRFAIFPGDFIMSGAGTIGRISRVPEDIKQGVFNQALIRMRISSEITDSEFFLQWMRSDDMQRKLTQANPASAMVNLVPMSEVKDWDVMVPNKDEQIVLGLLFRWLDNLITLHQRELDNLKTMKKTLLQKMFV